MSQDFRRQLEGYGLTTANILYRRPDHPWLLQTYVWQDYDLCPIVSAAQQIPQFLAGEARGPAALGDGGARAADQAGGDPGHRRRVQVTLAREQTTDDRGRIAASRPLIYPSAVVSIQNSDNCSEQTSRQRARHDRLQAERDHLVAFLRAHGRKARDHDAEQTRG